MNTDIKDKISAINNARDRIEQLEKGLLKIYQAVTSKSSEASLGVHGEVDYYGYHNPKISFPAKTSNGGYIAELNLSEQEYELILVMVKNRLTKKLEEAEEELKSKLK